ncbi:MAG: acyloxyacyl hydrolase [Muribaculaceae bacterium]|nr:acyloxyacyl hydrolase [Muribaculaceae bacterium]
MNPRVLVISLLLSVALSVRAGDSIAYGFRHALTLDARAAYAFPSYRDDILRDYLNVDQAKDTRIATSIHLQYGFSFPSGSGQGRIYPGAWQGIGTAVNFLGNPEGIGTPVSVYAFQGAPIWWFSDRLSLYYEWNFGASFGWRPCDGQTAHSNLIVGSRVNAYINLGAGLSYRINDSYSIVAGIDLTHYSNGNTSFPNPGVNMSGVRIGVTRFMGRRNIGDFTDGNVGSNYSGKDECDLKKRPEFDLTVYGSLRKRVYRGGDEPILLNGHFAVAGLDFAPMWKITRNFRAGASADFQWDESTDLKRHYVEGSGVDDIRFTRPPFLNQVCVGLSGRAELVMPIFSVNVGIGYNVIGPEETRASYQLANLKVRLTHALFVNIGYQLLNFQKQNNLMLGLGYTFR